MGTSNADVAKIIAARVKVFMEGNDNSMKNLFLDNLINYSEKVGAKSTLEDIIPYLSKLVSRIVNIK